MINSSIVVTGGAGFIGSELARHIVGLGSHTAVVVDSLTYAGSLATLASVRDSEGFAFERVDVCDRHAVGRVLARYEPTAVIHLAAETHVDRSIGGPDAFIQTNVVGTYTLLGEVRRYFERLLRTRRESFRFLHVSTDEVFGSLGESGSFRETSRYKPRSPYAASKAAADHLVRAWHSTYGLPTIVTNTSNNFGPYQHPEKLIPRSIISGILGRPIEVYGDGTNVRDWIYVSDHAEGLLRVLERGVPGETYLIGANAEKNNIDVVRTICAFLDEIRPRADGRSYSDQIRFVGDRPGHDFRYSLDSEKIRKHMGWSASVPFEEGLHRTVTWYVENQSWWQSFVAEPSSLGRLGEL